MQFSNLNDLVRELARLNEKVADLEKQNRDLRRDNETLRQQAVGSSDSSEQRVTRR